MEVCHPMTELCRDEELRANIRTQTKTDRASPKTATMAVGRIRFIAPRTFYTRTAAPGGMGTRTARRTVAATTDSSLSLT